MPVHEKISYVEYPSKDLDATKHFFQAAFGWSFKDYGPGYSAFSGQGLDGGGFFQSDLAASTDKGSALVVFYSDRLEDTLTKVVAAGGQIVKPIFSFPGGRRCRSSARMRHLGLIFKRHLM